MKKYFLIISTILIIGLTATAYSGEIYTHHDLNVKILPDKHHIHVIDKITVPEKLINDDFSFYLHGDLKVLEFSKNVVIKEVDTDEKYRSK